MSHMYVALFIVINLKDENTMQVCSLLCFIQESVFFACISISVSTVALRRLHV